MSFKKEPDKKEEERKGGGVPWMGQSAAVGARGFIGSSGAGVRGLLSALLHSRALLLMFAAATAGYSSLGLVDMHGRGGFGVASTNPGGTFFSPPMNAAVSSLPRPESRGGASSLEMAHQANQGALNDAAPAKETADAPADAGQEDAAPDAGAMAAAVDPTASIADAAKAAGHGGLARISGGLGGSGAGSAASMPAGAGGAGAKAPGDLSKMVLPQKMPGSRTKMPVSSRGAQFGRSGALRRLNSMSRALKPTKNMRDEFGASDAQTKTWEGEKPSAAGITGAPPSAPGIGNAGPSGNAGSGGGNPLGNSGSLGQTQPELDVPDLGKTENVTPYQRLVDLAIFALGLASLF
ncbi:MAG: hypothetical protein WCI75_17250, partial [candidate division NC10 bacterium]